MAASASASVRHGDEMRPLQSASATTVTIQNVRCAGTAKAGEQRVAERADDRGERRRLARRQAQRERGHAPPQASRPARRASPETSVTCSPEIDIRCVTPVRLKRRQSSREIARWSPTASAARMPAAGVGPSTR